jgi:hypothetical protein
MCGADWKDNEIYLTALRLWKMSDCCSVRNKGQNSSEIDSIKKNGDTLHAGKTTFNCLSTIQYNNLCMAENELPLKQQANV